MKVSKNDWKTEQEVQAVCGASGSKNWFSHYELQHGVSKKKQRIIIRFRYFSTGYIPEQIYTIIK